MADSTEFEQFASRVGGLQYALELALRAIADMSGKEARRAIEALRQEAIDANRNSDIPPEREMDHAQIAGPAINAIETVFDGILRELDD